MTDYAESLLIAQKALAELAWLLPEGKYGEAGEKALLLEQAARALVEACKRAHYKRLEEIARNHPNMQVLTSVDAVGARKCKASTMVYAHLARYPDEDAF